MRNQSEIQFSIGLLKHHYRGFSSIFLHVLLSINAYRKSLFVENAGFKRSQDAFCLPNDYTKSFLIDDAL